mgnify:FL=1
MLSCKWHTVTHNVRACGIQDDFVTQKEFHAFLRKYGEVGLKNGIDQAMKVQPLPCIGVQTMLP